MTDKERLEKTETIEKLLDEFIEDGVAKEAKEQLDRILAKCDDEFANEIQTLINRNILHIVALFQIQGHSGFSAGYAIDRIIRLMKFKPIFPITEDDFVYSYYSKEKDCDVYRCKTCSSVFMDIHKSTGKVICCDVDAISCTNDNGKSWFSCSKFRKEITLPYLPKVFNDRYYLDENDNVLKIVESII